MSGAKCVDFVKMKNVLDFKSIEEYYYICQEETERRKAHNRPHVRSADCEETVKLKNFLTLSKQSAKIVNVRREAKELPKEPPQGRK